MLILIIVLGGIKVIFGGVRKELVIKNIISF